MRFPHENNAILYSFFHEVPFFRFGLILGAFWGVSGVHLGAMWDLSGPQLGHLAASGLRIKFSALSLDATG